MVIHDALGHVAQDVGASHVDLPLTSAVQWLWFFATDGAGIWKWEDRLLGTWPTSWPARSTSTVSWPWKRKPRASGPTKSRRCLSAWRRELTEVQHGNVARMIRLGGGANFSVPGSGKTAMACATWAALRQLGDVDRMLVVAPLSAHEAWATEPSEVFGVPVPMIAIRPLVPAQRTSAS